MWAASSCVAYYSHTFELRRSTQARSCTPASYIPSSCNLKLPKHFKALKRYEEVVRRRPHKLGIQAHGDRRTNARTKGRQVVAFGAPPHKFTEQSDNVWYLKRSPPARKAASSKRTARPSLSRPNTSNPMDPSSKSRYVNECSPSPTPTQDQIVVQEYNNQRFHYQSEVS